MAEEGNDRSARLAALKARAKLKSKTQSTDLNISESDETNPDNVNNKRRILKFRNYTPSNSTLESRSLNINQQQSESSSQYQQPIDEENKSKRQRIEENTYTTPSTTASNNTPIVATTLDLDEALREAKNEVRETSQNQLQGDINKNGITNNFLMTHKINLDLKQDIVKQLDRLERRTQKAIVQLLKERLQNEAAIDEEEQRIDSKGDADDLD